MSIVIAILCAFWFLIGMIMGLIVASTWNHE